MEGDPNRRVRSTFDDLIRDLSILDLPIVMPTRHISTELLVRENKSILSTLCPWRMDLSFRREPYVVI